MLAMGFATVLLGAWPGPFPGLVAGQAEPPPAASPTAPPTEPARVSSGESAADEEAAAVQLSDFKPQPQLRLDRRPLAPASFPVVDCHTHFGLRLRENREALEAFVGVMDRRGIAVCVSLDGKLGPTLRDHLRFLWERHRSRFVVFAHIDWQGAGREGEPASWDCHRPDFAHRVVLQLEEAKRLGVSGLKVFKQLGLGYRQPDGSLVAIDDPRWDPIWAACGRLGLPVLIHTADPSAFFEPIDRYNERWEELNRHPEWAFPPEHFPARDRLHAARNAVIARHPETVFIAAHFGNDAEDLKQTAEWLAAYPNLFIEFASRISELGRQPYTARRFFLEHADRILFGTDGPWPEARLEAYWRFLETDDEYFAYSEKEFPPQGFWNIYGIDLPPEVLRQVYCDNAARLIPGVAERLASWTKQQEDSAEVGR
jgi:predicted TIM-barrel fold metal-dependent hydrolase